MITPKRSVGTRKSRPFIQGRRLVPILSIEDPSGSGVVQKTWTLRNNQVTFTFVENEETGVHLHSWAHTLFTETVYNKARSLWQLNAIREYKIKANNTTHYERYDVSPTAVHYVSPASIFTAPGGNQSIVFSWLNVPYDGRNPSFTVNIFVTVSLKPTTSHIDMSVSVHANQTYPGTVLKDFNSAIITAVHMPALAFALHNNSTKDDNTVFTVPIGWGHSIENPVTNLRTPRYQGESFHYIPDGKRIYHYGQPQGVNPVISFLRANYGHPGWMTIPALAYTRRDTGEGTLIYISDPDGTNPTGFQWYSDDRNLHLSFYNVSDSEVDPYGVGGRYRSTAAFNTVNVLRTSLRIRPFVSNTRWPDWYAFKIYKQEAVEEQKEFGWIPDSFYDKMQAGTISEEGAHIPMILNSFGYTTGNVNDAKLAATYFQQLYKNSVNPNLTYDPYIPVHIQPVTIMPFALTGTDPNWAGSNMFSWETWAYNTGLGDAYGPDGFKAPDYTGINPHFSGTYTGMYADNQLGYSYLVFPFPLSTGSQWVIANSGIDLAAKPLSKESKTTTNDDYIVYVTGSHSSLFAVDFKACMALPVNFSKFNETAEMLISNKAGAYHDTVGLWGGRGCYAKSHAYYNTGTKRMVTAPFHPRGKFTKYFIDKQVEWLSGWANFSDDDSPDKTYFGQCSEYVSDLNLKYVPLALMYEAAQPMLPAFFSEINNPRPDMLSHTLAGTLVDKIDDTTLGVILSAFPTVTHFQGACVRPNWLQRCPAYQIAHSDKTILNEWITPHASNIESQFFFDNGILTGTGAYGQYFYAPTNQEQKMLDWGAWGVTQWPYLNRLTPWEGSSQWQVVDTGWTGVRDNIESGLNVGPFTGHTTGVVERLFRLQAYCPDYIYHGTMEHPLEGWSTNTSANHTVAIGLKGSLLPFTGTGRRLQDDKVIHTVRKHRSEDNYLVILHNWYSGQETFSAQFIPSSYDINTSYQVYTLDVNSDAHGTRTFDSILSKDAQYTLSATLNQYEMAIFEIVTNATSISNIVFADLKTDYSYVRYSYDVDEITTTSLTVSYSYGTTAYGEISPPLVGFKAPSTHAILNNLPQWMKMRQSFESRGWKLTNSWGMGMENVVENINSKLSDLNLITVDHTLLSKVNYVDISDQKLLERTDNKSNLLFNSSFTIKDAVRSQLPAGWERYGEFTNYRDLTTRGPNAICFTSNEGVFKLGQQVILDNILINELYASVYVKCNASNVDIRLHISVEKMDGTSIAQEAILTNRSSEWVRLVLPVTVRELVYRVNYTVTADCDGPVSISSPQLETSKLSLWSSSIIDLHPVTETIGRFNIVKAIPEDTEAKTIPLIPVGSESEFIEIALPTRVEKKVVLPVNLAPFATQIKGRRVTQLGEIFQTEWVVLEDQVVERAVAPTSWDIFGRYDIRDLRYYEDLIYGTRAELNVTITPLAAAVRKDLLFVACKEIYNNKTIRTLKVIDARVPPSDEDYIESVIDFNLELDLTGSLDLDQITDEEITSIGFSEVDTSWFVVNTSANRRFYYRLYFDYYYFDGTRNRLYTIEKYEKSKISVS